MEKSNILYFKNKKYEKSEEEENYIAGAINFLMKAKYLSKSTKDNPMMLTFIRSSIRGVFYCIDKANITLEDIDTSIVELKNIISPPEHLLSEKDRRMRWNWVLGKTID